MPEMEKETDRKMETTEQMDDELTIDLRELGILLRRNLWIIIVCMLLAGIIGGSVTYFFVTPQYEATATLIVNARTDQTTSAITNDQIVTAAKLADTYGIIIKSDTVLEQVIENLNLEITYGELQELITTTSVEDTQILEVAITHPDVTVAVAILHEITNVAPEIILEAVEAGSVKLISNARGSKEPVSPHLAKNIVISALAGAFLSVAIMVLRELFNNTLQTEDDITKKLGLTVIGVIPKTEGE